MCRRKRGTGFLQSLDSDLSDGPITAQEYLQVKNALVASEAKIQQLLKVNVNLSDELRTMQKKVALHSTPCPPCRVAPLRPPAGRAESPGFLLVQGKGWPVRSSVSPGGLQAGRG